MRRQPEPLPDVMGKMHTPHPATTLSSQGCAGRRCVEPTYRGAADVLNVYDMLPDVLVKHISFPLEHNTPFGTIWNNAYRACLQTDRSPFSFS